MKINITYRQKKSGISMTATKSGDINVSAPIGTPESEVQEFIEKHRDWIESMPQRLASTEAKRQEAKARDDAFFDQLQLVTASQCDKASRRLNAIIPPLVKKYEQIMDVKANGFSYRRSKTRWGSCNTRTHHINFSAYLLLLPDWCIEHVVVHELAHIIVPNHSVDFYAVMDKYFPRWKEAREETKRISRLEEKDDDVGEDLCQ